MSYTFNDYKYNKLRLFWSELDCSEKLQKGYIKELAYYMETSPELNADRNLKSEAKERVDYLNVANQAKKLLKELEKISELDRLNILSVREIHPEYNGRNMPSIDPLQYIQTIIETAGFHSYQLHKCSKFDRQLHGLKTFIQRFPQADNLTKDKFIELFITLHEDKKDIEEVVTKAIRNIKYENLGRKK